MSSGWIDFVGYAAGGLATLAFVPQVVKSVRDRSVKDISFGMYVLFCAGIAMWLFYGILIASPPVIVSNTLTLLLAGIVLGRKIPDMGKAAARRGSVDSAAAEREAYGSQPEGRDPYGASGVK